MLSRSPRLRRSLGPVLAATSSLLASPARGEDLVVGAGVEQYSGEYLYENVTIEGTLDVRPWVDGDTNRGWIYLRARQITITETGVIDAAVAGYLGTLTSGAGYDDGAGAGQTPASTPAPAPGGGGAHYGAGGIGTAIAGCTSFANALGGAAYDLGTTPLGLNATTRFGGLGSSGGAGWTETNGSGTGGRGGGLVILEAGTVALQGVIRADGQDAPQSTNGVGVRGAPAGGGAGGSVILIANAFTYGPAAEITARGGRGATDADPANYVGGGGGGGRVVLQIGAANAAFAAQAHVEGGVAGTSCTGNPDGAPGLVEAIVDAPCVDADHDGWATDVCEPGGDCHDGDPNIHPEQVETCNLIDDDCSGEIDDPTPDTNICPQGAWYLCTDGTCAPDPNAPTPEVDRAFRLELGGGFCAASRAPGGGGAPWLALLLWLARRHGRGRSAPARRDREP